MTGRRRVGWQVLGILGGLSRMKPKIKKEKDKWTLTYGFWPRQFWLFGLDKVEQQRVTKSCVVTRTFDTLENCFIDLAYLYKNRQIRS